MSSILSTSLCNKHISPPDNSLYAFVFLVDASTILKEGQEVEVAITLIDKRTRKVNLSMKAKDSVEEKAAMADYNSQSKQASGSTLGDLLKEAKDK